MWNVLKVVRPRQTREELLSVALAVFFLHSTKASEISVLFANQIEFAGCSSSSSSSDCACEVFNRNSLPFAD